MSQIDLNTTLVRSDKILTSPVEQALVMMDVEGGAYYSLDEIGTAIWAHLAEPLSVGQLCDKLTQRFKVQPEVCQQDVIALLDDLIREGLVLCRN